MAPQIAIKYSVRDREPGARKKKKEILSLSRRRGTKNWALGRMMLTRGIGCWRSLHARVSGLTI